MYAPDGIAAAIPRHLRHERAICFGMDEGVERRSDDLRVGQAAEILGVSSDTLRRWEVDGRLTTYRSTGGQRRIPLAEVRRLLAERRTATSVSGRPIVRGSARNRFPGIVTRIERSGVVAVVEILAGPHRVVSLMTAEAVDEMGLAVGDEAIGVVKATTVIVEIPAAREVRS